MTAYIRVPIDSDGVVAPRGQMEKVEVRADATEVVYGDAAFLQERAYEGWPELDWQILKVAPNKYVVVARGSQ
jgi:hypothetical protein